MQELSNEMSTSIISLSVTDKVISSVSIIPSSLGNSNQRHTVFLRESRRGYGNIYLASLMKQLYPKEMMADDATNYLLALQEGIKVARPPLSGHQAREQLDAGPGHVTVCC